MGEEGDQTGHRASPPQIPPAPRGLPCLLGLLGSSSVVVEDERAHGHGQVGPAHAGLAAEEQRRRGSAGVPQQQAGALLGGRDRGMGTTEASRRAGSATAMTGVEVMTALPRHGGVGGISPLLRGWRGWTRTAQWVVHPLHSPAPRPLQLLAEIGLSTPPEMFPPPVPKLPRFHLPG